MFLFFKLLKNSLLVKFLSDLTPVFYLEALSCLILVAREVYFFCFGLVKFHLDYSQIGNNFLFQSADFCFGIFDFSRNLIYGVLAIVSYYFQSELSNCSLPIFTLSIFCSKFWPVSKFSDIKGPSLANVILHASYLFTNLLEPVSYVFNYCIFVFKKKSWGGSYWCKIGWDISFCLCADFWMLDFIISIS